MTQVKHNVIWFNHTRQLFQLPLFLLISGWMNTAYSEGLSYKLSGDVKYRYQNTAYDSSSLYYDTVGKHGENQSALLRLNNQWRNTLWEVQLDFQSAYLVGDSLKLDSPIDGENLLPTDDKRAFNLTYVDYFSNDAAIIQRIDRAFVGFRNTQQVIKLGRQAISWGNGLFYAPMDFVNPFDPSAIDTEYKTGDDMLYGQFVVDGGNDIQYVIVGRRDSKKKVTVDVATFAVKYHVFIQTLELDFLLAEHYSEAKLGFGAMHNLGSALWRGDWTITDTKDEGLINSLVTNISYSWMWRETNYSAMFEYFYNGFGTSNGDYSATRLQKNTSLTSRLARAELYTLAKDYLAVSVSIEIHPLFVLSPNFFINLNDQSVLFQLLGQYDPSDSMQLILALNAPMGPKGSEYSGITVPSMDVTEEQYLSFEWKAFIQLAWYF